MLVEKKRNKKCHSCKETAECIQISDYKGDQLLYARCPRCLYDGLVKFAAEQDRLKLTLGATN